MGLIRNHCAKLCFVFFIPCIIFLSLHSSVYGQWTVVTPPTVSDNWSLSGVHFTSANEGWAVGGQVLLHYQSGVWTSVTPPAGTVSLSSVHFTSANEGWAVGGRTLLHYQNGVWTSVTPPDISGSWWLSGVHFSSANEGWAVGGTSIDNVMFTRGVLLHYQNGVWTSVTPPEVDWWNFWSLSGVHFTSANEGWAVGPNPGSWMSVLLHYQDGVWTESEGSYGDCGDECYLYGVHFSSANEGWAVGHSNSGPAAILAHYQDGLWTMGVFEVNPFISGWPNLSGVHFTSADEGWAVGGTRGYSDGYEDHDGKGLIVHYQSEVWTLVAPPDINGSWSLSGVHFTSANEGWAVGHSSTGVGVLLHYIRPTLTVGKSGTGSGTITATGITCGSDCTEIYPYGTVVVLTASPNTGSSFTSWTGCDSPSGNTCTVNMTANKSVSAAFTLNQHTLTVGKSGTGSGTITATGITCGSDCTELVNYGTALVLTASPSPGSSFSSWSGCDSTSTNTCTVNMTSSKSVGAAFTLNQYTLTAGKSGTGSGTITGTGISCGADCSETYLYGTVIALTANPNPGTTFSGWTGCDAFSSTVCAVTITGSKSVSAAFTLDQHTLTTTKTGTGSGTLSASGLNCVGDTCTGTYNYGDTVTINANPSTGSVFGEWTGCDSFADRTCTVNITSEKSVTASFFREYTLAINLEGTGDGRVISIPSGIDCEPTCSETFVVGTPIQLSAKPYGDSVFAYWSGACTGTTDTCDLTMSDYIGVTAHFTSENTKEYALKVKKAKKNKGDGTITSTDGNISCGAACSYKYYKDTVIILSADANEGSTFIGWKPESPTCTGTDPCTVTIDKAKTVQAVFVGDYTLKVTAQGKKGGTGLVSSTPSGISCSPGSKVGCAATYPYAQPVTLSASPDARSTFLGWSPTNLCSGTGVCMVPMDKKRTVKAIFSGQ